MPVLVAVVLIAHALIHLGFVSPVPSPKPGAPTWPFDLQTGPLARSGRLSPERIGSLGRTLVLVVLVGYALAVLGLFGFVGTSAFPVGVIIGSLASLALLLAGFHPWLTIGIVLDVALVLLAISGWRP